MRSEDESRSESEGESRSESVNEEGGKEKEERGQKECGCKNYAASRWYSWIGDDCVFSYISSDDAFVSCDGLNLRDDTSAT